MPNKYTTNYHLNQWAATDRVQRVDFNADNAKLDAALKAIADQARRADLGVDRIYLQEYDRFLDELYAGKNPEPRSYLRYDAFRDSSKIASLTSGLTRMTLRPGLIMNSESYDTNVCWDTTQTRTVSSGSSLSAEWFCENFGRATAVQLYMSGSAQLKITAKSTGSTVAQASASSTSARVVTFTLSFNLTPGETYILALTASSSLTLGRKDTTREFGFRIVSEYNGTQVTTGTLISKPFALDGRSRNILFGLRQNRPYPHAPFLRRNRTGEWVPAPYSYYTYADTKWGDEVYRFIYRTSVPSGTTQLEVKLDLNWSDNSTNIIIYDYAMILS